MDESTLTRRGSLLRLGGFLVTALGAAGLKIETSEGAGPAAVASGAVSCILTGRTATCATPTTRSIATAAAGR